MACDCFHRSNMYEKLCQRQNQSQHSDDIKTTLRYSNYAHFPNLKAEHFLVHNGDNL